MLILKLVFAIVSWLVEHIADGHIEVFDAHGHIEVLDNQLHILSLIGVVASVLWAWKARRGSSLVLAVVSWLVEHIAHGHTEVLDNPLHILSLIGVVASVLWARKARDQPPKS